MVTLSKTATTRLLGVHQDLVRVIKRAAAISDLDFTVSEGVRSLDRQAQLKRLGASWTMRSRHVPENNACRCACAVDLAVLVDGKARWDWPLYHKLATVVKEAARLENVPIEWGGDWSEGHQDGPHFQLPWEEYP